MAVTPLHVPSSFEREMGYTEAEFRALLRDALHEASLDERDVAKSCAEARFADGALRLSWQVLPARRIALLEIPRLFVCFRYEGLSDDRRHQVQRRFDLVYQRGGG